MPASPARPPRPRLRRALALVAALLVVPLTGCTVDPTSGTSPNPGASDSPHTGPMRIAVITHGDAGGFWSTVRRGAEDAAATLPDVTLDYQGSAGDARLQSEMINAAINQGADAIAVSAPDPGAIRGALDRAEAAGIPLITLNSGAELSQTRAGIITHVGQSERAAGVAAGQALAEAGATKVLCVVHEQNNSGLQERCGGTEEGLGGEVIRVQVTGARDPGQTAREIGAAMDANDPDAVLTLDPDIASAAIREVNGRDRTLATFDLSPAVLDAVQAGEILFAVDQQPYLQGYLPVTFLELAVRNRNEVGAGGLVATGPALVTKENAGAVAALAEQGTR
ncbi:MAG TPA: substrate-binding domain-containing protein [Candidatus Nanopelagicales bacterium]